MSRAKWLKFLNILQESELKLGACLVKFVADPKVRRARIPLPTDLQLDGRIWWSGLGGLGSWSGALDCPEDPAWRVADWPPIPFKLSQIEWLFVPRCGQSRPHHDRTVPSVCFEQDVDEAARLLSESGQFPIELSDEGLLVIGHLAAPPDKLELRRASQAV